MPGSGHVMIFGSLPSERPHCAAQIKNLAAYRAAALCCGASCLLIGMQSGSVEGCLSLQDVSFAWI